jgi:Zn-dependent protease with chaperone function
MLHKPLISFYALANDIENALSPTPPDQINRWEKNVLKQMQAVRYCLADPQHDKELLDTVKEVCQKNNQKNHTHDEPKVIIYEHRYPNAMFFGITNTMFVSTSLLQIMDKDEVKAVIGHEDGHRTQRGKNLAVAAGVTVATLLAGSFLTKKFNHSLTSDETKYTDIRGLVQSAKHNFAESPLAISLTLGVITAAIGTIIKYPLAAFQQAMELDADKRSVETVGKPEALISALTKLTNHVAKVHDIQIPSTDPNAKDIARPIPPKPERTADEVVEGLLTSSHPPLETRATAIRKLGASKREQLNQERSNVQQAASGMTL